MLPQYNKAIESWKNNRMDNASTEVSLVTHPSMLKEGADHLSVFLFTKDNMEAYKPVPVVNLPPVSFIGGHSK